jgi:hypothetical protein
MATSRVLQITDSQTGLSYQISVVDGAIRAVDLRQIKVSTTISACSAHHRAVFGPGVQPDRAA